MKVTSSTVMGRITEVELPPIHVEKGSLRRQLELYITHGEKIHFLKNYVIYCDSKINIASVQGKDKVEDYFTACKRFAKDLWAAEVMKNQAEKQKIINGAQQAH